MSMFDNFFAKGAKALKISTDKEYRSKFINGSLLKFNYILFHKDLLDDMREGNVSLERTHYGLTPGITCHNDVKSVYCSYTPDCPHCLAQENWDSHRGAIYEYCEKVLKAQDVGDSTFYKEFKNLFGLTNQTSIFKVFVLDPALINGRGVLTTRLFKVSPACWSKFEEFVEKNQELFTSGDILKKVVVMKTNGLSKKDIRYEGFELGSDQEQMNYAPHIPQWDKVADDAFENFKLERLRPSSTPEEIIERTGGLIHYNSAEEIIQVIHQSLKNQTHFGFAGSAQNESKNLAAMVKQGNVAVSQGGQGFQKVELTPEAMEAEKALEQMDCSGEIPFDDKPEEKPSADLKPATVPPKAEQKTETTPVVTPPDDGEIIENAILTGKLTVKERINILNRVNTWIKAGKIQGDKEKLAEISNDVNGNKYSIAFPKLIEMLDGADLIIE